jgi:hypothetical protein
MSIFNDKALKSVAEAASKIMAQEATHPKTDKEKDLAALSHPKDKITHKDVLVGRGVLKKEEVGASKEKETKFHTKLDKLVHKTFGKSPAEMKEETEQLDELSKSTLGSYINKASKDASMSSHWSGRASTQKSKTAKQSASVNDNIAAKRISGIEKATSRLTKEEVEQLDEYQSKGGVYTHKGTYGGEKGAEYGDTDWDKENKDAKKMAKPKASRKLGARQNFVRSKRVNEGFSNMISAYNEIGLKSLAEVQSFEEEVDNETFTKELEDQKASMEGKKKQPSVSAPATQGVKQMPEEIEIIDANEINGVTIDTIEERTLTEPETKKKEEVVKSMKKNLSGFKDRYGDRAKSVAFATATKIAKEKA